MNHPFKIIRGGESEPQPAPKKKAVKVDNRRQRIEAMKSRFIADCAKSIEKANQKTA